MKTQTVFSFFHVFFFWFWEIIFFKSNFILWLYKLFAGFQSQRYKTDVREGVGLPSFSAGAMLILSMLQISVHVLLQRTQKTVSRRNYNCDVWTICLYMEVTYYRTAIILVLFGKEKAPSSLVSKTGVAGGRYLGDNPVSQPHIPYPAQCLAHNRKSITICWENDGIRAWICVIVPRPAATSTDITYQGLGSRHLILCGNSVFGIRSVNRARLYSMPIFHMSRF